MTPDEKRLALKTELLVNPEVLAPGPDLSPIKPEYQTVITTAINDWNAAHPSGPQATYGGFTDKAIETYLGTLEASGRPAQTTSQAVRGELLHNGWGRISLAADRVPAPGSPEEGDSIMCRNVVAMLTDPQRVWTPEQYSDLVTSSQALLDAGMISGGERTAVLNLMTGQPITKAYNKSLVDQPTQTITADLISDALRNP